MAARVRSESAQRVSGCVTALLREQPFFGSLALRLPVRADAGRETLASDGREIRYSPQWIAETDAHVIETAIARVVLACALKHHTRRGERDPERWQRASQLVTHGLLRDAGFTLPPDAEAWDGISVEEAYDRLPQPDDGESGDGDPPDGGGGSGADAAGTPMANGSEPADEGDNGQQSGDGDAGSGGPPNSPDGGDPEPDDVGQEGGNAPASSDPSGTGEVMDAPVGVGGDDGGDSAPSPGDMTQEEQAWDEAMHQALNLAKAEGKAPGRIEETVRGAHASTLDWRSLLRRYMTDAVKSDYSWSVPNNRHGERMFAGNGAVAFGKPPFTPIMVSEIVAWWRAVADRLNTAIPVHTNQVAALAALKCHDLPAQESIAVESCTGGYRLVRQPRPVSLLSLPA